MSEVKKRSPESTLARLSTKASLDDKIDALMDDWLKEIVASRSGDVGSIASEKAYSKKVDEMMKERK